MILGFSHLTHTTATAETVVAGWRARGWDLAWADADVPSAEAKWPLMAAKARAHGLSFLEGPVRVEVIAHDTGAAAAPTRLALADDAVIEIAARDPARETAFLTRALHFVAEEGGILRFPGRMPGWSVRLRVIERADAPIDPPLDVEGLSCLAFLSTAPEADAETILAEGGREPTAPFALTVNGRRLRVLMLRSPEGTPIELVKVETRS